MESHGINPFCDCLISHSLMFLKAHLCFSLGYHLIDFKLILYLDNSMTTQIKSDNQKGEKKKTLKLACIPSQKVMWNSGRRQEVSLGWSLEYDLG